MTVQLTGNFLATARCLIFQDASGITWTFNPNTNALTASATGGSSGSGLLNIPQTTAEAAVSVTPVYLYFAPYNILRYGADPTGVSDSTTAINNGDKAATQAGAALYFPAGVYSVVVPTGAAAHSITMNGCSWVGDGRDVSVLKSATGTYGNVARMFAASGKSNFTISRLGFDLSNATVGSSNFGYIGLVFNCTNWKLFDCAFTGIKAYSIALYPNGGDNWAVSDNYFNQPTPSINQSQAVNVQANSGKHQVCRNVCIGTGIFSNGNDGLYEGNLVNGWGFGGGIVLGPLASCISNRVIGNYVCNGGISTSYGADSNGVYPTGVECWSSNTPIIGNYSFGNAGCGIKLGGSYCSVSGNVCFNNGQGGHPDAQGILNESITSFNASNNVITGNRCFDNQGSPTQTYGYQETNTGAGVITANLVYGNDCEGNKTGDYSFAGTSPATLFANGALSSVGAIGVNGNSPPAQSTGWGTPTGGSVQNNYQAGVSATLLSTSDAVAQIITVLKQVGILGA